MPLPAVVDPRRWPRETRLLVVTIVLSIGVLVTLARFRFPARQPLALPVQPLQQLAARAAFDDLSAAVTRAAARVRPSVLVIARAPAAEEARSLAVEDVVRHDSGASITDYALALRFRPDLALVVAGGRPLVLAAADARRMDVRGRDDLKGISVIRVPPPEGEWRPLEPTAPTAPQYLLIAEALAGGIAMRPLFGGPASDVHSPYWERPLVALGQREAPAQGALVFALEGSFVGAIVRTGDATALVPADALIAAAARIAEAPPRVPATLGIHLQALDAALAAATGTDYGVAVSAVDPRGPAAGVLQPGDVITAVADHPAGTPENALLSIAGLDVSRPAVLQVFRSGRPLSVTLTPRQLGDEPAAPTSDALGLTLRASTRGAVVTEVAPASAGEHAGFAAGDVITSLAGSGGATPRNVTTAYAAMSPGTHVVVGLTRGGKPLLVALTRPGK